MENIEINLKTLEAIIKGIDCDFRTSIWENYGKRNIYVEVGNTGKKVTIHCGNQAIYINRPGAYTEAQKIQKALAENSYNFDLK